MEIIIILLGQNSEILNVESGGMYACHYILKH
jgi:hypothetical protein